MQARYQRTIVPTPDGGTFGLDWFRCEEACQRLPDSAPVLLILHSITGDPDILCIVRMSLTPTGLVCLLQLLSRAATAAPVLVSSPRLLVTAVLTQLCGALYLRLQHAMLHDRVSRVMQAQSTALQLSVHCSLQATAIWAL